MKRVKSSNQEFAIAGRLVTIRTRWTSSVPHQVVRRQRLAEPRLGVPQHLGLAGLEGGDGLVDGRLLLGTQDVVVLYLAVLEVGEVLAGEVVEVLQRRLRRDREVVPLGPLRRGLALHALLVQVGVEVLVREAPTGLGREQRPDATRASSSSTDSWDACCAMRASALSCSVYPIFSHPAYLGMSGVVHE